MDATFLNLTSRFLSSVRRRKPHWLLALLFVAPAAYADSLRSVAVEADGSIVVVSGQVVLSRFVGSVARVHPATGATSIVSSDTVGAGVPLRGLRGIAVEPGGSLLVSDPGEETTDGQEMLIRVDPLTGDRTILSAATTGTGPELQEPYDLAVDVDGSVFVLDRKGFRPGILSSPRILRVDPSTGDRTMVSDFAPDPAAARDLAVEPFGTLLTIYEGSLIRVDPSSGDRTIVSNGIGTGPEFEGPYAVAVGGEGTAGVLNLGRALFCRDGIEDDEFCLTAWAKLFSVDPTSGDRRLISGGMLCPTFRGSCITRPFGGRGLGTYLARPDDIAFETEQSWIVIDDDRVVRVNARTGWRRVLAEFQAGASSDRDSMTRGRQF